MIQLISWVLGALVGTCIVLYRRCNKLEARIQAIEKYMDDSTNAPTELEYWNHN